MPRPRTGSPRPRDFNPNSPDAMFSKIIARLDAQDEERSTKHEENKKVLGEILVQVKSTNGRVTKLEQWKMYVLGFAAAISLVVALVWKIFFH